MSTENLFGLFLNTFTEDAIMGILSQKYHFGGSIKGADRHEESKQREIKQIENKM